MKAKFLQWGACLMMLLMAAACSNDSKKMADLLDKVPADVDFVAVGNVKMLIESAGGSIEDSKIIFPKYMADKMKDNDAEFNAFLQGSGIDVDACAITCDFTDDEPTIIFALDDEEQFVKAIKKEDFDKAETKEEVVFYSNESENKYRSTYIGVKDGYAYMVPEVRKDDVDEVIKNVVNLIADAAEQPYGDTKFSDYITDGNAAGLSVKLPKELRRKMKDAGMPNDICDLYEGVVCMKANLTDKEAKINIKWLDEEGNEKNMDALSKMFDMNAKINKKALSYIGAEEFVVYAVSMKNVDWDGYLDMVAEAARMSRSDKAAMTVAKSYLEKIDGTMAVSFGLKNGIQSIANVDRGKNVMNELPFTVVCEVKEGKAKGIVSDVKKLLDQFRMPYTGKADGIAMELPQGLGSIYLEAKDDILVLSNRKISADGKNAVVSHVDFGGYIFAAGAYLSKDNPLMKDVGVKSDVKASMTTDAKAVETTITLEMDGDEAVGIIEKVAKTLVGIADRGEQLEEKFREARINAKN